MLYTKINKISNLGGGKYNDNIKTKELSSLLIETDDINEKDYISIKEWMGIKDEILIDKKPLIDEKLSNKLLIGELFDDELLINDFNFFSINDISKKYKILFDFNQYEDTQKWVFKKKRNNHIFFSKISCNYSKMGGASRVLQKYNFNEENILNFLNKVYKYAVIDILKNNELSTFTCIIINTLKEFIEDNEEEYYFNSKILKFLDLFQKIDNKLN
jgi:hypothetical protein